VNALELRAQQDIWITPWGRLEGRLISVLQKRTLNGSVLFGVPDTFNRWHDRHHHAHDF
jgi:hypothetical protein